MRRIDPRMARGVLALSLPTLAVVALGIWFMVEKVPSIVAREDRRVKEEYLKFAKELQSDRTLSVSDDIGRRGKSWQMSPGYWGWKPSKGGRVFVWYSEKRKLWAREVDAVEVVDFATVFWVCGTLVLAILVAVTAAGIRFFVDCVKTRDDFVAEAVHDLATPLVVSRGLIGVDDEALRRTNEHLLRIVENLSAVLRLGGRHPVPKTEIVDVRKLFDGVYALFSERYRAFSGGEDMALAGESSLCVLADETLVTQILWNLVSNEIKYAAKSRHNVGVRFVRGAGSARVEIRDDGPGMTAWERRRIFDRFYRSRRARRDSGSGGFGIGLGNARLAARRMKGDVTVSPNDSGGSTFVLSLPVPSEPCRQV